jgi:hypothetical protein
MENKINVILTPEIKESVLQAIKDAKAGMPFLIKLSKDDRKSLQKMDDGRKPFVLKGIEFANSNTDLDPGSGLLEGAPNDVELYSFLASLENEVRQLLEMVVDTKQLAGSEAYEVGRFIYLKAKMNVQLGIPGSQAIVDELSKLFKQNAAKKKAAVK